jgi:hypothetical protein
MYLLLLIVVIAVGEYFRFLTNPSGYYPFLGPLAPGKDAIHESYSIIENPTIELRSDSLTHIEFC